MEDEAIPRFLRALFRGYDALPHRADLRLELRCLAAGTRGEGRQPPAPRLWEPLAESGFARACRAARGWSPEWNVYFGVLPRLGCGGRGQEVAAGGVLWCDIDNAPMPETAWGLVEGVNLPLPHLTVGSGNGCHLYWRLAAPVVFACPQERVDYRSVLRRLCFAIGEAADGAHADLASADVARILRLPDTLNHKQADAPRPVRLLRENPEVEALSLLAWRALLPVEPCASPVHRKMPAPTPRIADREPRLLREFSPHGTRHRNCTRLLVSLRMRGASESELAAAGREFCSRNGFPVDEMEGCLRWALTKIGPRAPPSSP